MSVRKRDHAAGGDDGSLFRDDDGVATRSALRERYETYRDYRPGGVPKRTLLTLAAALGLMFAHSTGALAGAQAAGLAAYAAAFPSAAAGGGGAGAGGASFASLLPAWITGSGGSSGGRLRVDPGFGLPPGKSLVHPAAQRVLEQRRAAGHSAELGQLPGERQPLQQLHDGPLSAEEKAAAARLAEEKARRDAEESARREEARKAAMTEEQKAEAAAKQAARAAEAARRRAESDRLREEAKRKAEEEAKRKAEEAKRAEEEKLRAAQAQAEEMKKKAAAEGARAAAAAAAAPAAGAGADAAPPLPPPAPQLDSTGRRYLVYQNGYAGVGSIPQVLVELLALARATGRVLVEPCVRGGQFVPCSCDQMRRDVPEAAPADWRDGLARAVDAMNAARAGGKTGAGVDYDCSGGAAEAGYKALLASLPEADPNVPSSLPSKDVLEAMGKTGDAPFVEPDVLAPMNDGPALPVRALVDWAAVLALAGAAGGAEAPAQVPAAGGPSGFSVLSVRGFCELIDNAPGKRDANSKLVLTGSAYCGRATPDGSPDTNACWDISGQFSVAHTPGWSLLVPNDAPAGEAGGAAVVDRLRRQEAQVMLVTAYRPGTLYTAGMAGDAAGAAAGSLTTGGNIALPAPVAAPAALAGPLLLHPQAGPAMPFALSAALQARSLALLPWSSFHACRAASWAAEAFNGQPYLAVHWQSSATMRDYYLQCADKAINALRSGFPQYLGADRAGSRAVLISDMPAPDHMRDLIPNHKDRSHHGPRSTSKEFMQRGFAKYDADGGSRTVTSLDRGVLAVREMLLGSGAGVYETCLGSRVMDCKGCVSGVSHWDVDVMAGRAAAAAAPGGPKLPSGRNMFKDSHSAVVGA